MNYSILSLILLGAGALIIWQAGDRDVKSSEYKLSEPKDKEFEAYWYAGEAEITKYDIMQARYGEMREGEAVFIFVTEHIAPDNHIKAYNEDDEDIPVMKLNATRNFQTGIYPYSLMSSTFTPVEINRKPGTLRVTFSSQEWCGHTFEMMDLKDENYLVTSHSYFPGEGDRSYDTEKAFLEDELWGRIKISPHTLPVGKIKIIPSMMAARFAKLKLQAYGASAELLEADNGNFNYILKYEGLNRTLSITFEKQFPYHILGWEEQAMSGFGDEAMLMTTVATRRNYIKNDYWNNNRNSDTVFINQLNQQSR